MLKLITVGKMKNRALAEICADFTDRLKRFGGLEIVELKDSTPEKEGERIIESLKNFKGRVYVMSEEGRTFSSKEFYDKNPCNHCVGNGCDDCRDCPYSEYRHQLSQKVYDLEQKFKQEYGEDYDTFKENERKKEKPAALWPAGIRVSKNFLAHG